LAGLDGLGERHRLDDPAVVVSVHESRNEREDVGQERLGNRAVISIDDDLAYAGAEPPNLRRHWPCEAFLADIEARGQRESKLRRLARHRSTCATSRLCECAPEGLRFGRVENQAVHAGDHPRDERLVLRGKRDRARDAPAAAPTGESASSG
jgi:hypothetical protein